MRVALFASALSAICAVGALAIPQEAGKDADTPKDDAPKDTIFNGVKVPPMKELDGETFGKATKNGYWWIKHYSPYCGHCKAIAPHWQTMYEYYTTSSPLEPQAKAISSDAPSLNTFDGYYNFHFSSINCVTNGDKCDDHDVKVWPTFVLYKDGKEIDRKEGQMSMEEFMHYTEEKLEQIKPGSRPREGIAIPEPGSTSVDRSKVQKPLAKDKDAEAGKAAGVKHNSVASVQLTATATSMLSHETARYGDPKPTHARPAPNPAGKSIPLTAESFQKLVTSTQDEWFIKFYAPWCTHCQALAPTWAQMAKENAGKLNIGEVNCDAEPRLCKDARVKAYPTIYFFRGGERVEYDGLRGLGDLLGFTKKALDSDVKYVNASGFKEMEETEEVIFVFFFDHGTTSEDFAALDRLTLSLIGHAKIVKTDSAQLAQRFRISTWPRLMVSRDGRASFFTPLAPKDVRDFRQVLTWMQSVWLPVVPELSASNAQEILNGRLVVLGILDRNRKDEFTTGKRELKNAALEWMEKTTREFQAERQEMRDAKQLRIEEAEDRNDQRALRQAKSRTIAIKEEDFRKPVGFAWVDGIFWERWIRTTYGIDVSKGERVIINDEDNRQYFELTDTGHPIVPSRTSILETLPRVVAVPPKLKPKTTIGTVERFFFQIRTFGSHHPALAFGCIGLLGAVVVFVVRGKVSALLSQGQRGGYVRLDGKEGLLGMTMAQSGGGGGGGGGGPKAD